jgi:hypothetical protein
MPLGRMYGRRVRRAPTLVSLALSIAAELTDADGEAPIEVIAHGDSLDYQEWVTVRVRSPTAKEEMRLADEFAKRITRYGAVAV